MKFARRTLCLSLGAAALMPLASWAQEWPAKQPIRIVVPFPAGGTSDVLARLISLKMTEKLGQTVLVENRAGNAGNLGADLVAKSPADGYTFVLMDVGNLTISPALYKLPFDVIKDFVPVAMVGYSPHLLVVSTKVPASNIAELIKYAKANPGKLNFAAAAGMGSAPHMAGVQFARRNGIQWNYVPYKGGSQAVTDTVAGQTQVIMNGMLATLPHVQSGRLKVLGISKKTRMPLVGDVPTLAEQGVTDFESGTWQGALVANGTPAAIIARLNAELIKAIRSPDVRARLTGQGAEVVTMQSAEQDRFFESERKRWGAVVAQANIKLD